MKKLGTLILAFFLGTALFQPLFAQVQPTKQNWSQILAQNEHDPSVITVKLKADYKNFTSERGINHPVALKLFADLGIRAVKRRYRLTANDIQAINTRDFKKSLPDLTLVYQLQLPTNTTPELLRAMDRIQRSKLFQYIVPETYDKPLLTPNDPLSAGAWWYAKMQAEQAWEITKGDTNVVVGIIDTSFDLDHPDLVNQIKYNWNDPINGVDDDNDGYIDNFRGWDLVGKFMTTPQGDNDPSAPDGSVNPHGAIMSGTCCAQTNNNVGVAAPAFNCKFMPIKCAGDDGSDRLTALVYDGILYAAQKGCKILNCSFGSTVYNPVRQELINFVTRNYNCLILSAMGNGGYDTDSTAIFYPANYENVFALTGTDENDRKGGISTYGYGADAAAPAKGLSHARYNDAYGFTDDGYTSAATAMASGVAALVASKYPNYSGKQIGELIRVTADPIDNLNPEYKERLGKGRLNMLRALTENPPSVRKESIIISDGNNNLPEPGETANLNIVVTNYLAEVSNLNVLFSVNSPYITVQNPNQVLASITTLESKALSEAFRLQIAPNCPENLTVRFRLGYQSGNYDDYEYFTMVINPTYRDMNINLIGTSFNGVGNFGYNDYPDNNQGLGLTYEGNASWLYEGGLILSAEGGKLSNNIGNGLSTQDDDFITNDKVQYLQPGTKADAEITTAFSDTNRTKVGVKVNQRVFAYKNNPDRNYIIVQYEVQNVSGQAINDFHAGWFADWDVDGFQNNTASFDKARKLAFTSNGDNFAGLVSLNDVPVYINNYDVSTLTSFSRDFKKKSIISDTAEKTVGPADIIQFIGAGPYNLPVNGTLKVAFALVAGKSLVEIQQATDQARTKYLSLSADTCRISYTSRFTNVLCAGSATGTIEITPSGGTEPYQYSLNGGNAQTNPIFTGLTAGTYNILIRDNKGCEQTATVTIQEPKTLRFKLLTKRHSTCNGCNDGVIVAQGTGGVPPYQFSVGNQRFTANVLGRLVKGRYTVTLKDANGCTQTREVEIR